MDAVPHSTTVPTAVETSCGSPWMTGCAASTALHPQMVLPVVMSMVGASSMPSTLVPKKCPRVAVDDITNRSRANPLGPMAPMDWRVSLKPYKMMPSRRRRALLNATPVSRASVRAWGRAV